MIPAKNPTNFSGGSIKLTSTELELILGRLSEEGFLKERYNKEENDLVYSVTEQGEEEVKELLRNNYDYRIMIFKLSLVENGKGLNVKDDEVAKKVFAASVLETTRFFKRKLKYNFLEDLYKYLKEKELGVKIKEEDKESFLKLYDELQ